MIFNIIIPTRYSPQFKRAQRERARALVHERLEYWSAVYRRIAAELGRDPAVVTYGRVSIRSQKTRWGSCSRPQPAVGGSDGRDGHPAAASHPARPGNLNFNWKIALLPPALADYIVVHELCHLIEFNHSPAFWAEVARTVPEYKRLRKELRVVRLR